MLLQLLQGIESVAICVEAMDEWLALFNVKLRHMREDIEAIETRNSKLELHTPLEVSDCLAGGSFDESCLRKYIEPCEWLRSALQGFDALDPSYAKVRAVKEKRAELEIMKLIFVRKACVQEF